MKPFDDFPKDLLVTLFSYLPFKQLLSVQRVNKRFYQIAHDDEVLWRNLFTFNDITNKNFSGKSFLTWACLTDKQNYLDHCYHIIEKEFVNPDNTLDVKKKVEGRTLLRWAITCRQSVAVVKKLLEQGADIEAVDEKSQTPLIAASAHGNIELVNCLLEHKANINAVTTSGMTALMFAVLQKNLTLIESLLKQGADVNQVDNKGMTVIYHAVDANHLDIFKLLLQHLDAKELTPTRRTIQSFGSNRQKVFSILHHAIQKNRKEMVVELLDKGADIEAKADGDTPLLFAVGLNHKEISALLIERGANVNAQNNNQNTPLHVAVMRGYAEIARLLLKAKADTSIPNRNGTTSLNMQDNSYGIYRPIDLVICAEKLKHDPTYIIKPNSHFKGSKRMLNFFKPNNEQIKPAVKALKRVAFKDADPSVLRNYRMLLLCSELAPAYKHFAEQLKLTRNLSNDNADQTKHSNKRK